MGEKGLGEGGEEEQVEEEEEEEHHEVMSLCWLYTSCFYSVLFVEQVAVATIGLRPRDCL